MEAAMDTDLVSSNKICHTCRTNLVPSHSSFKNCAICREKNRIKETRRAERKREELKARKTLLMETMYKDVDRLPTSTNATSSGSKSSRSSLGGTKKQAPRLLHELEGKEKKYAIMEIKASLSKKIQENGGAKVIVAQLAKNSVSGIAAEFQSASSLYEQLKTKAMRSSAAGKRLRFYGCHSIVADPTIDHGDRVFMVMNDLQKIAQIPFGGSMTLEAETDYLYALSRICHCKGLSGGKQPQGFVKCGGTVKVTAELDGSHPHGLEGQKISVQIDH